jgi:hypothetical protein
MTLALVMLLVSIQTGPARPAPASHADLTIRTRSSGGSEAETVTLQIKGQRQRQVEEIYLADGRLVLSSTQILLCDLGRAVWTNDSARLYVVEPIRSHRVAATSVAASSGMTADTRPVVETRTIDAVDTGERRAFGPLTARHVITTTTVERDGAAPRVVGVRDGWYADIPPRTCDPSMGATAVLVAGTGAGRVDVKWRGTAKTGFPLEERDRVMMDGGAVFERRTEFLGASYAAIPAVLFDMPAGYQPALPLPGGGYDFTRPDTIANRASALWRSVASWASYMWGRF